MTVAVSGVSCNFIFFEQSSAPLLTVSVPPRLRVVVFTPDLNVTTDDGTVSGIMLIVSQAFILTSPPNVSLHLGAPVAVYVDVFSVVPVLTVLYAIDPEVSKVSQESTSILPARVRLQLGGPEFSKVKESFGGFLPPERMSTCVVISSQISANPIDPPIVIPQSGGP